MSSNITWRTAFYTDLQTPDLKSAVVPVGTHPLAGNLSPLRSKINSQSSNETFSRDNSTSKNDEEVMWDPLSSFASEDAAERDLRLPSDSQDELLDTWSSKKAGILSRFGSGSERLSLASSYLSGDQPVALTSMRHEQLDSFDESTVKELKNLSVQEYTKRITELRGIMVNFWERDEKVNALKIVIQCAKLLVDADTSVRFYPAKVVLIVDVIDKFGELVCARLRAKHATNAEEAAETARNWFYKISSIRELIPRFYVEASILDSYRFLDPNGMHMQKGLLRLAKTTTGIGDPLVAAYARCYLARVGARAMPSSREHLQELMYGLLVTYKQLEGSVVEERLKSDLLDLPSYYALFMPAIEFLLQCVTQNATEKQLNDLLNKCTQGNSALLLNSVLAALKPQFVASKAEAIVEHIHQADTVTTPRSQLYRSLGLCLMVEDPPEDVRVKILNSVWKHVARFKNAADYMSCAEVWVDYVCRHMEFNDINTFIAVTIKQMNVDRAHERHQSQLYAVIERIASNVNDLGSLFNMDRLLPLLDLIQKDPYKTDACRSLLELFNKQKELTSEEIVISSLMHVCKTMLSSVNALMLIDTRKSLAALVCGFINRVEYSDVEKQLTFYMNVRAALGNLDDVLISLVHNVNRLIVGLQKLVHGHHSRKSAGQTKACLAYNIVTVPSVSDTPMRFKLYMETASNALKSQCISHADDCYEAAIEIIPQIPDKDLYPCVTLLLGQLVYSPDDPRADPLGLFGDLLKAIEIYSFEAHSDTKARIWIAMLRVLSRMANPWMEELDLDCNDTLYGGDQRYVDAVEILSSQILSKIIDYIAILKDSELFKRQGLLLIELLFAIASHGGLQHSQMEALFFKLWTLTRNLNCISPQTLVTLRSYVHRRSSNKEFLAKLV